MKCRLSAFSIVIVLLLAACSSGESAETSPTEVPSSSVSTPVASPETNATPTQVPAASATPVEPKTTESGHIATVDVLEFSSADEIPDSAQFRFEEKCESTDPTQYEFADYEMTIRDFECIKTQLGWPLERVPNQAALNDIVDRDPQAEIIEFQGGFAHMTIANVHACQWQLAWLDASRDNDPVTVAAANFWLEEVAKGYASSYPDFPEWVLEGSKPLRHSISRAAYAGDTGTIASWSTSANCWDMKEANPKFPDSKSGQSTVANRPYRNEHD